MYVQNICTYIIYIQYTFYIKYIKYENIENYIYIYTRYIQIRKPKIKSRSLLSNNLKSKVSTMTCITNQPYPNGIQMVVYFGLPPTEEAWW